MIEPGRRRNLLVLTWIAGAVVALFVAIMLGTNPLQVNDSYSSIASALLAVCTVFVSLVLYLRREKPAPKPDEAAEALVTALLEQWEPELRHRRERSGTARTIPLTWARADEKLADAGYRLRIGGRLDTNTDQAARRLAQRFGQLPGAKRLVVLGEPGAGKTFLAMILAVGLLRQWSPGEPVPVLLSLSSWDPLVESLDDWMVREIASLYYGGRQRTPRTLLTMRLLLPMLDGLDELPEHVRRLAITRINHTLEGDRPLVLTCRAAEYSDDITGGAPVLMRAAVVQVQPVSTDDAIAYLSGKPAWAGVTRRVRLNQGSPLATALSTPLMLSLFAAAYRERSPADLLDNPDLKTRHAVEDHVVDVLLDTAYPADSTQDPWWSPPWTAKQGRRWLTFLAKHLHEHGERDLSTFQLAHRVIPSMTAPVLAFVAFLLVPGLVQLAFRLIGIELGADSSVSDAPPLLIMITGGFAASMWLAKRRRTPGRVQLAADRSRESFGSGMVTGMLSVLSAGVLTALPVIVFGPALDYGDVTRWSALTCALIAMSLVAGLGVGLHEVLVARMFAKRGARAGVTDFLRKDRSSTLLAALTTSLVVGVLTFPVATLAAALGGHLGQRVALMFGMQGIANLHLPELGEHVPWPLPPNPGALATLVELSLVLAITYGLAMLATRTWTRFLIARVALFGQLPWRIVRFLADARERGLLRGAGGYYQFGHVRLQERLIATAVADRSAQHRRTWKLIPAGLAVVVVLTGVVVVIVHEPGDCRSTGWAGVDQRMTRTFMGGESGCFAYLRPDEWSLLAKSTSDSTLLAQIESTDLPPDSANDRKPYSNVLIVGEFDRLDAGQWHNLLEGVAAAQRVGKDPIQIGFVFADVGSIQDREAASLTTYYVSSVVNDAAVININVAAVVVTSEIDAIGLKEIDIGNLVAEHTRGMINDWTGFRPSDPGGIAVDNGLSDGECAKISESSAEGYKERLDLRTVKNPLPLLDRIARCGNAEVLVDNATADTIRAQPDRLGALTFVYVQDDSASMERDCVKSVGSNGVRQVVTNCVATLAAADRFRVSMNEVERS